MKIFYILIAILILGFIVIMHELGHFIVARLCGISVSEFSIGFGPKLIGLRRREIDYSLRAFPLGGYCRFYDENDDVPAKKMLAKAPVWKRFLVFFAGSGMNFVLAFVFCVILLCSFIIAEVQPRVTYIYEGTPAAAAQLQAGDVILKANGQDISYDSAGVDAFTEAIGRTPIGEALEMDVLRDGEVVQLALVPEIVTDEATGEQSYQIGVGLGGRRFTLPEAAGRACGYMVQITGDILDSLKNLIFRGEGVEDMYGTVGMISYMSDMVYDEKLYAVVNIIFVISLNLGIMNLLPLPGLDGGHLLFLIVEAIRRKPLPPEKEGLVHGIGFLLLFILFLLITYKDIMRLIAGG